MDPLTDTDRQAYAAVETALRTYPLANAPRGFTAGVMRRLPPRPALPRFRLSWVDGVVSLCGASVMAAILWSAMFLTPQTVTRWRIQGLLAWQFVRLQWRGVSDVMVLALLLGLAGLALAAALFGRSAVEKRLARAG